MRILVDRSLPADRLARALRDFGFRAESLEEAYPGRSQAVQDVEWIADTGQDGRIVLTSNPRIWRTPHERQAIHEHGARVFCLASAQQPTEIKTFILGRWWLSIERRSERADPCFWRMHFGRPIQRDLP